MENIKQSILRAAGYMQDAEYAMQGRLHQDRGRSEPDV